MIDTQVLHNQNDSLRTLGAWITKRFKKANKALQDAEVDLQETGVDEQVLRSEWAAQVESQTAKFKRMFARSVSMLESDQVFTGQSGSVGDKAIDRLLLLRENVATCKKQLATLIKARRAMGDDELGDTEKCPDVAAAEAALRVATEKLQKAKGTIKGSSKAVLTRLKGNKFVSLRINAQGLKLRIRSKVIAYKFEHGKIGRAFNKHEKTGKMTLCKKSTFIYLASA